MVQVVAPAEGPVFVIDPALQLLHTESVDLVENLPGAHAVHVVAPEPSAVLVIEPAWQLSQYDWPPSCWNFPAVHDVQATCAADD